MQSELQVITPHLRGNCLTVDKKLHVLFKIMRRSPDAADRAWQLVRQELDSQPASAAQRDCVT
jgi:hypothetical protein